MKGLYLLVAVHPSILRPTTLYRNLAAVINRIGGGGGGKNERYRPGLKSKNQYDNEPVEYKQTNEHTNTRH